MDASEMPIINADILDRLALVDEKADGIPDNTRSKGFWYWAKKYHDNYGPVILIQLLAGESEAKIEAYLLKRGGKHYRTKLKVAFPQYIGRGRPANEYGTPGPFKAGENDPPQKGCFMSKNVYMDSNGGNLREVAVLLNKFIKNMNGEGEICCGGKGINF